MLPAVCTTVAAYAQHRSPFSITAPQIQADCLATSLQHHILSSYKVCMNLTILASARTADWRSFRVPAKRAAAAGPALRVWRCALHRLLHYSCQMGSLLSIEVLLSQVGVQACSVLLEPVQM